ncbi:hypothetical protein [Puniceibacterium confluentis]|uniref:hypothetical protein n=1 Tax=Puniceibacterium confluentis TaxID=1958944 RepID=UPI0011B50F9C|nr:hypothetical protein [Puniceibacterium confluentis]
MPVSYAIRPELGVMVALFHGSVTVEHIRDAFMDYQQHPDFDGRYSVLMDQAECSFPVGCYDDYRQLAYRLRPHYAARHPSSRTAFFAPGDIAYGMSRMYKAIAEESAGFSIEVFRTAGEALRFVGVDPLAHGAATLLRPG